MPGPDGDIDVKTMAQMQNFSESVAVIEAWEAQCTEDARALAFELANARTKFEELDTDSSGTLEHDELKDLALWVFDSFHPGGEALSAEAQDTEVQKLLGKMDDDGNGMLSLEEFADWFRETSESLRKVKRSEKLKQQQAVASSTALAELEAAAELRKIDIRYECADDCKSL